MLGRTLEPKDDKQSAEIRDLQVLCVCEREREREREKERKGRPE
ncbi:MAG TPA: hypothetical protein V6C97_00685 [Oculatellaceae cyanobacterium]